jgi:hypothetical protein
MAQVDSLIIVHKSGLTSRIALNQIQKITFENVSSGITLSQESAPELTLQGNFPNPIGLNTLISFGLPAAGNSIVNIFNVNGLVVRTFRKQCTAGRNVIEWDALDEEGRAVPDGVYYYTVRFRDELKTQKMIVAR